MAVTANLSAGQVLTASTVNNYMINSGLVYVTSATVGSGVSSVTVSNAFSSTYDNYKIIYSGGVASTGNTLMLRLGSTTSGYNGWVVYGVETSNAVNGLGLNNAAQFTYAGAGGTNFTELNVELISPNQAKWTIFSGSNNIGTVFGTLNAQLRDTTQYTAFTILTDAGTLTGGTITVYGYRKA